MILIIGGSFQGKEAFAKRLAGKGDTLVLNYHNTLRQAFLEGRDIDAEIQEFLKKKPELVTMDEIGCGIIPMERIEREFREAAGHAGQLLAKEADQVYRVICGIPERIK